MSKTTHSSQLLFGQEIITESSVAQQEIFSASLSDPEASLGYNHSISIFLEGKLDIDALYSCLLNLLDRHEALRGRFSEDGTQFLVREKIGFELPVLDLSEISEANQKKEYDLYIRQELSHVFDLVEGPLFRSTLVKHSETRWTLVFNCHHVVVDGWSLKIILDDLPKLYSALVLGTEETGLDLSSSFIEYLETARTQEKESAKTVKEFWKSIYKDGVPVLDLPLDQARPLVRTYESKREDYKVDRKIYDKIKEVGAKNGTSQFVTLLSAFSLFLHRISNQEDLVVGVPAAGQIKSGKSKLLGHDARMMPIRCITQEKDNFKSYSKRIMESFFAAYDHQWVSMPDLIRELKVDVDAARVPFVSVMFNYDPGMNMDEFHFEGLKSSFFFNHRNSETFEISINSVVEGDDLVLECAYNAALFSEEKIHQHLQQFEQLMASIGQSPQESIHRLKLVPDHQRRAMEEALNSTSMVYEPNLCVDELISEIVQSLPENTAVEFGNTQLNYRELWNQSGKIAQTLLQSNLGPKPLVGVMLERSAEMVPVLLGIWRAGGAFVPLDPEYPLDRLQYMVEHSAIELVLTQASLVGSLEIEGIQYSDIAKVLNQESLVVELPTIERSSRDIAYVIYTSGSTGKPKGVQVPHQALNNFLVSMKTRSPGISPQDRVMAITTLSFDIAELELWLPLITGARTVIVDRGTAIDGQALIQVIQDKKITFMQATPATWRLLVFSEWEGDKKITALCGGEALPRDLAGELLKRVGTLWNVYGPTETTVWSTMDRVTPDALTIGKPIGNTQAYVLDANQNWVPRGSIGELWLGGDGVTLGYLGRPDLTQERFMANPFTGKGYMYKTGDLVRLRNDHRIEYVGRNDFQVKVRGYRIELGEVQHALSKHSSIRQSTVVVKEKSPGDAHLVAYYTLKSQQNINSSELKAAMRQSVPDYMLPSYFVELAELPLTNNGKINVKALPDPFQQDQQENHEFESLEKIISTHPLLQHVVMVDSFIKSEDARPTIYVVTHGNEEFTIVQLRKHIRSLKIEEKMIPHRIIHLETMPLLQNGQVDRELFLQTIHSSKRIDMIEQAFSEDLPSNENERYLAHIWKEYLGPNVRIRKRDNFYNLGGHSLLSVQMIAKIQKQTGYRLSPRFVLLNSLDQLAKQLPKMEGNIA